MEKKHIIITTINNYEKTSIEFFKDSSYEIIVVGDIKTNHLSYDNKNIFYIHPDDKTFDKISKLLPFNHYCRKNLGYLYAIHQKSSLIFDTDDDNYPLENFNSWKNNIEYKKILNSKFPNIMSLYTDIDIWARGYPLEYINNKNETYDIIDTNHEDIENIGIYQSLVDGDPDVDAIYRLTNKNYNNQIEFKKNTAILLNKNCYTQGNTQATIWVDKQLFFLLYIPCTTSFRFCDILKMYIAQKCMWEYNKLLCYISPIVFQQRNVHDYMEDFKSEYEMYINLIKIIDNIFERNKLNGNKFDLLIIYNELLKENIVKDLEILIIKEWLTFF